MQEQHEGPLFPDPAHIVDPGVTGERLDRIEAELAELRSRQAEVPEPLVMSALEPDPPREPGDVTRERFSEADADAGGWIRFYEPIGEDKVLRHHLVPRKHWARYEAEHGF
ncbi:hypothetical protein Aph01nite_76710 [Acrocarpospora phusangensis]|uniref:Uncharacterized protein n=1 Tax=Acrocarpospora phusangensis TaxID=1070424 RepID=A0A919QKB4_9ACTN|nr:hypothetical protein [Acrocarpospora phusangensis]GIH29361.1 hypothetical protein Aph01nite_76710 [Acrocarpospora phusangensis]